MKFEKYLTESISSSDMVNFNQKGQNGFTGDIFIFEYKAADSIGKMLSLDKDNQIHQLPENNGYYLWKEDGTLFIGETAQDFYTKGIQ